MSESAETGNPTAAAATWQRSGTQKLLLACGFGGTLFIAAFVVLGILAPNYSSFHDAISTLEFTPLSLMQRANFFAFGLVACAFAAALRGELTPGRGAVLIPVFQFTAGIGVIGDAIFIHDPLHLICDLIAFNSSLAVLFLFAWRFRFECEWKGWSTYSILTGVVMMAFLTAFGLSNRFHGPAGLMEKLASSTRTCWSIVLTAKLLSGKRFDSR
jgi:hypothetical protein